MTRTSYPICANMMALLAVVTVFPSLSVPLVKRIVFGGESALDSKIAVRSFRYASGTALGGSSLGGLVTLHVGLTRPGVFGTLVAMSPSVWWDRRVILSTVRKTRPRPRVRVWVDMGTAEGRRALDDARLLKAALVGAGWTPGRDLRYAEYEGATHSEAAWAARFPAVVEWLYGET